MKRDTVKPALLLAVPILALLIFGAMLKNRTPQLVLESAKVSDYNDVNDWGYNREIIFIVRYDSSSLGDRFFPSQRDVRTYGYNIPDESGQLQLDENKKGSIVFADSGHLSYDEPSMVKIRFRINTSKIPPSAGQMTFNTTVAIDDSKLPVGVVVNE